MKQQLTLAILVMVLASMMGLGLSTAYAQDDPVQATVAPDLVFVRETPNGDQITEFPRDLLLNVLGRENQAGNGGLWVLVTPASGGPTGWVLIDLLNFDASFVLSSLQIINPDSPELPTTASEPPTTDGATDGSTTSSSSATAASDGLPGQTNQLANLRSGPELTYEIVQQYQANTDATFLGRNANSVWLYVVVEGQAGWFFSGLVDVDGDISTLCVVTPDGICTEDNEPVTTTTTDGEVAPSASGGTTSGIILSVKPGTPAGASDGRLNGASEDLGSVLVYCVNGDNYTNTGTYADGGIAVYRFAGENQGVVLFVDAATIDGAKSSGASGQLGAANGYNLYYVDGNTLQLTGTDSGGDTFIFEWENCNMGGRVD